LDARVILVTDVSNYLIALHAFLSILYDTSQAIYLSRLVYKYSNNNQLYYAISFTIVLALVDW
jgi:low affinity Fe/Cu permease